VVLVAAGVGAAVAGPAVGAAPARATVDQLSLARSHLAYEVELIDRVASRVGPADSGELTRVRATLAGTADVIGRSLAGRGVSPQQASLRWEALIGDGAPTDGKVHYTCSLRLQQSDTADLAATPGADVAAELASIELSLLVEGRQLAAEMGPGGAGAALAAGQRTALRQLAPLLISSDRAFAASA